ncbi:MAG: hypothetical protein NC320_03295 [Clostridium sp.]|nr:hypothetical protein [Clostridium sp.]
MQFLKITKNTTLSDLSNEVGARNVDSILNLNSLSRTPDIGKQFDKLMNNKISEISSVDNQKKITILNTFTSDADVFETAAFQNTDGWKALSALGTMPGMLRIPETIKLPDSVNILGGSGIGISKAVYEKTMTALNNDQDIDPSAFNSYSSGRGSQIIDTVSASVPTQWFKLPWGKITLSSSLSGKSVDFPVYPKGIDDSTQANYETMPETLYQYEPWQIYKSSGPRTNTYDFDIHRDMWSGDHRDGKCNELIRFCQSNCYPKFQGASVQTSTVTLYIAGKKHITGIMTNVKVNWDDESPIGLDGFYLHLTLSITITEVSEEVLTYETVQQKGLIG